ncbi:MAG: putative N-acetylmannosamine-6-phosphate 2-epimerase [Candidatus Roseilinea sp.]|nr:MAG: putative N-acetylmannosamine-6-phosphate 2-epimerase [Candidatus Roseilinea sp.]
MTAIPRGLIVSCQASAGEPLFGAPMMAAMARAAEVGGAVAIRANGPEDIAAIRQVVGLPIIGLWKLRTPDSPVYITPHRAAAEAIARAGCDVIAVDATPRPRPDGATLDDLIPFIRNVLGKPVMADCACVEDALLAESLGADYLGTTLAGYTRPHGRPMTDGPDLDFVAALAGRVMKPIIAEGRFYRPDQAARAMTLGAHAVCVGGAITRPQDIARRFVDSICQVL